MNFDNKPISFAPKPLEENPEKIEYLLLKVEFAKRNQPKMSNFKDIYTEEEIEQDKQKIKKYQDKWSEEKDAHDNFRQKKSDIYEAAVVDVLGENGIFGEGGEVIPASRYDDIFSGIDGVLVQRSEEDDSQYLGLNMDVTFSSTDNTLEKKIESIKQSIRVGVLPTLKYFQDPKTKEHKKISLPKIIIGSSESSADGLIKLWGETNKDNSEALKNHPIQSQVIMEGLIELIYFYNFSKNLLENTQEEDMKEKYSDICYKYGQMYNYFHSIYESKKDLIESHYDGISKDIVYKKLLSLTKGKI